MYEKFLINEEEYVRTSETVNITLTAEHYYYYLKGETQGNELNFTSTGVNLVTDNNRLLLVPYPNEDAVDDNGERLPAGAYQMVLSEGAYIYGISTESVVSSPEDLFVVWYPPIEEDPVHIFLKNQSTSFAGTKTPIRWTSKTDGKKLRVYRANQLMSGYVRTSTPPMISPEPHDTV